ncbi:MAG: replicative DNA helicase [Candidatus Marinimicrobia bacterium]|nr:replicative DNA helicase [Candidatus Neomarinimicrobiota bacterium]
MSAKKVKAGDSNGELRLPPQNLEAEQAVLGAILLDPKALDRVIPFLPPKSFYKEAHNHIYDAMLGLQTQGDPVDTLTLSNHLSKLGTLDQVGGAYYLTGLAEGMPSAANVEHYADIVREKYVLREIIGAGNALIADAYQGESEPNELLDDAEHRLFDLQRRASGVKSVGIEPIMHKTMTRLDQQHHDRKKGYLGIPTGFEDLDEMTDGFQPSDLVILAGRPSMGKTAFALGVARNAAKKFGHRVGIFSMEMSEFQVALRFITAEAEIDSHRLRRRKLHDRDWPKISKAAGDLSELPIYIDDTAGLNILELRSRIRRFKADYGIEMAIIDYLQLLAGPRRSESRQQEIAEMTRSLKGLAKELDIVILALSQLSRAPEQRPGKDKRPIMSDLRESGAIEQDADVILFLYRQWVYSRNDEDLGKAELIIGKQRNGPTGRIHLTFRSEYASFASAAPEDRDARRGAEAYEEGVPF